MSVTAIACNDGFCVVPLNAATLLAPATFEEKAVRKGSFDSNISDASTACSKDSGHSGPEWTKQRVLALCQDLLQGFSDPQFKNQLKELFANSPDKVQVAGRMELALTVQRSVLPRYGFEASVAGVEAMRQTVCPFTVDWMVRKLVDDIDTLLGLPLDATTRASMGPRGRVLAEAAAEGAEEMPRAPQPPSGPRTGSDTISEPRSLRIGTFVSSGMAPEIPQLTKAQVLELLGELLQRISGADFQRELQQLPRGHPGRKELVLKVQSQVLPKHGLPGTRFGHMLMLDAITPVIGDFLVGYLVAEMDDKLGLPRDTTANLCQGRSVGDGLHKGKRAASPEAAPRLTRRQVLTLCNELLEGFLAPDFQEALQALLKSSRNNMEVPGRSELAMKVQSRVLPKYGLPGTTPGVILMLDEVAPYAGDWLVAAAVNSVDESLGMPAATTLKSLAR